jgi:hypothetical protein
MEEVILLIKKELKGTKKSLVGVGHMEDKRAPVMEHLLSFYPRRKQLQSMSLFIFRCA